MSAQKPQDLAILKQVLEEIFHAFPKTIPEATVAFSDRPDYTSPRGYEPLVQAFVNISERNAGSHLLIERASDPKEGYRICMTASGERGFSRCSHVVHVPMGAEGSVNSWKIDFKAAKRNPRLTDRLNWVLQNYKDSNAAMSAIGVLLYDAAMSGGERRSPYEITRRSGPRTYYPGEKIPRNHYN